MIELTGLFIFMALILGCFLFMFIRSWLSLSIYITALAALYMSGMTLLSRPKPIEFSQIHKARVIAYVLDEPNHIYIWTMQGSQPRSYSLPWREQQAAKLRQGMKRARKTGRPMMVDGVGGIKGKPMFYPKPVQPLPPKEVYK